MKKIGLCLSGGGARGAYQIGAIKALQDAGILEHISHFSGTSIGAANASLIASSGIDKAKEVWFSIPQNALKTTMPFKKRFSFEYLKSLDQGIFETSFLEEVLVNAINFEQLKTKKVFVTLSDGGQYNKGVFDLITSTFDHYIKKDSKVIYIPLHEIQEKDVIKSVLASCAIPVVFPSVKSEEKKYYDGGVFDNIPVAPLIEVGCDVIIIIHLNKTYFFATEKYENTAFIEIKSKTSLGSIFSFSNENSKRLFDMGYSDAMNVLKPYLFILEASISKKSEL
ncbi:MAG: patatin-like phospholipase family protein [Candidatus Izemoplasmatales bacterium]|jgi:NTE family protein|nr:patatin-like phospholipase family protein [Candidatus Izemoplasmatales bacterium]